MSSAKILVIDDSRIDRLILKQILSASYVVLEAENGKEAEKLLELYGSEIESIILDLVMPDMDGYTFLKSLKDNPVCKEIPVLAASASSSSQVEQKCLSLGVWDFIYKPFDPIMVSIRIENSVKRFRLEKFQKKQVMDTFERYVDPVIVNEIMTNFDANDLFGKTVELVVLFVDIRSFTTYSEKHSPEDIVKDLNRFLELGTASVKKYEGIVDKYIGDCIMAFWGAPLPCENAACKACMAGLEIARNARDIFPGGCGVGIHKGPAVVGNIGAHDRMSYTAIGDTVNTASRMEDVAKSGQVYISKPVVEALAGQLETEPLEESISLKGKAEKLQIYRLLGQKKEEEGA